MPLSHKQLESIDHADLQGLIGNEVAESKVIDYKQTLPGDGQGHKKKFLADVSSFANASGGDLIYGMKESAGVPVELCGLDIEDPDREILRLDNLVSSGIDPRTYGVEMRAVPIPGKGPAIVVRIPRSWTLPHMVTLGGDRRFYSRSSAGKYPLDVSDLRILFGLSHDAREWIRRFRLERLANIVADETPVLLRHPTRTVLHLVPMTAAQPYKRFDMAVLAAEKPHLKPLCAGGGWNECYNLDGFCTYIDGTSYLQFFLDGAMEAVECLLLRGKEIIPAPGYEAQLVSHLGEHLAVLKRVGVEPPLVLMLTLLGVKGYSIELHPTVWWGGDPWPGRAVDRPDVLLPEILVDSFESNLADLIKPAFDAMWNAAGWERSLSYDEAVRLKWDR